MGLVPPQTVPCTHPPPGMRVPLLRSYESNQSFWLYLLLSKSVYGCLLLMYLSGRVGCLVNDKE